MSRASSIRSAAQATFSAPRQVPIRWRLAGGSALLTLVILCGFAGAVGGLTSMRLHEDFEREVERAARVLAETASTTRASSPTPRTGALQLDGLTPDARRRSRPARARSSASSRRDGVELNTHAPDARLRPAARRAPARSTATASRRARCRAARRGPRPAQPLLRAVRAAAAARRGDRRAPAAVSHHRRARRRRAGAARRPHGRAPRDGADRRADGDRAQDRAHARPRRSGSPTIEADDEVAELARTLDDMLHALDASRAETEGALARQREFVADASHELRTPLTSVLANLELLADSLDGDQQDAAHSALRSSRRMRRLVADLLLLARHDAARQAPHTPTDVGQVLVEAAAELGVIADGHELSIERQPRDRRRRARRAAPPDAEPHGERDPPHAARARRCARRSSASTATCA